MKPSTGGCAAFLNSPRSKFAQMTQDCLFERRRWLIAGTGKLVFVAEVSYQHAAKAARSIQSPARQSSVAASERAYESHGIFCAASRSPRTRSNAQQPVIPVRDRRVI